MNRETIDLNNKCDLEAVIDRKRMYIQFFCCSLISHRLGFNCQWTQFEIFIKSNGKNQTKLIRWRASDKEQNRKTYVIEYVGKEHGQIHGKCLLVAQEACRIIERYSIYMVELTTPSLSTLSVELLYRILDYLRPSDILLSLHNVCTYVNTIVDSYYPYQDFIVSRMESDQSGRTSISM